MYLRQYKWTHELIASDTYFPPFFFDSISRASFEYAGALMRIFQHFGRFLELWDMFASF